ncbi:MAG TPA: MaoC family dehydratase [Casimicrobiaceae bacterium]|nr:MaoC family dehydratase [Casimicrobiaceae bacterium]
MNGSGARYDDVRLGTTFSATLTVTETHLVLGAGLIGDFNPHHVNESYARNGRFGGRILHGMLTAAVMGAPLGTYFHGTAIALVEHNVRFVAPVRPGDTLTTTWTIVAKDDKPKHAGGIVSLMAECRNQDDVVVAIANSKMLAGNSHEGPGGGGGP